MWIRSTNDWFVIPPLCTEDDGVIMQTIRSCVTDGGIHFHWRIVKDNRVVVTNVNHVTYHTMT